MEIQLAPERLFLLEERLTVDEIQQRAMDKRTQAFAGGLGSLLQRPKTEEIFLVGKQRRLQPFWHVAAAAKYVYERNREYTVPFSAPDVEAVTVDGIRHEATAGAGPRGFRMTALEHCRDEFRTESFTDGLTGAPLTDAAAVMAGPRSEVSDPAVLSAENTIALPPEHRASFVVRKTLQEVMKPVQADRVLEESITLENTDLYYRPIWAFEFAWQARGRQGVVEVDSVTGLTSQGRGMLSGVRGMLTRDLLFDVGADTVGLFVPGGSIAVKLAKAAIDNK